MCDNQLINYSNKLTTTKIKIYTNKKRISKTYEKRSIVQIKNNTKKQSIKKTDEHETSKKKSTQVIPEGSTILSH